MTTAPSEQPPRQVPPEQEQQIAQTVAEILLAGLALDATVSLLAKALKPLRIGLRAVRAALTSWGYGRNQRAGSEETKISIYSAYFLVNSSKRIQAGLAQGEDLQIIVNREKMYLRQHLLQQAVRAQARREAKEAAYVSFAFTAEYVFRWRYSKENGPCKPIKGVVCKQLDGKVFPVTHPPQGLYPGERHPNCKCKPLPVMSASYTDEDPQNP